MKTLLAAFTDFGGAQAALPVLQHLYVSGEWRIRLFTQEGSPASLVYKSSPISIVTGNDFDFGAEMPDVVLTGIACADVEAGKAALQFAVQNAIPSAVLLETWPNRWLDVYKHRDRVLYTRASEIMVPDYLSVNILSEQGFRAERIVATGNPTNDIIAELARERAKYRTEIRCKHQIPLAATVALFVTTIDLDDEANNSPHHPEWLGRKEEDVVREYLEAIRDTKGAVYGLIRQKPGHGTRRVKELIDEICPTASSLDNDPYKMGVPCLLAADVVFGVATLAVQNAAMLGIPAVYYLPDLCKEDPMITNKIGVTIPFYNSGEMGEVIRSLATPGVVSCLRRQMTKIELPRDATANVVREIEKLVQS